MKISRVITFSILLLFPFFTFAQGILSQPLTRIPGITDADTLNKITTQGIVGFLNGIITFFFTIAGVAAVVMIVAIGFQYATAEKSGRAYTLLREKGTSLALGVALIFGMFIIFNFINPQIINNLNIFSPSDRIESTPGGKPTVPEDEFRILRDEALAMRKEFIAVYGGHYDNEEERIALLKVRAEEYLASIKSRCEQIKGKVYMHYREGWTVNYFIVGCSLTVAPEVAPRK